MAYTTDKEIDQLTAVTSVDDADYLVVGDTSDASEAAKSITWSNFKGLIGTYITGLASYFNKTTDTLDDITTGSTNVHFTATDNTKLDGIEALADVTDENNVVAALSGATLTAVTVAGTDKVVVQDASDTDNIKTVTAQSIADLGGGGGDMSASTYDPASIAEQLVGLTATQTLTNKTLTSPTFNTSAKVGDDVPLYFDTAGTTSLKWNSSSGQITIGNDTDTINYLGATKGFAVSGNAGAAGAGTYEPSLYFLENGGATINNTTQGSAGAKTFTVNFTDGLKLKTGGSSYSGVFLADNIATSDKTFQLPNTSGTIAITSDLSSYAPLASPTFTGTVTLPTGLTGVIRADSGVVSTDSDVTDIVSAASTSAAGKVELATSAETTTGTDTGRAITPDGFAGSDYGKRIVGIQVFDSATDTATGDGKAFFRVPSALNGYNLVAVAANVYTAGTTGTTDIQIRNVTDSQDMLSTKLTIDSGETDSSTAATAAVINTTYDDVATGDKIAIDVDAVSTTAAQGLFVELIFQLP